MNINRIINLLSTTIFCTFIVACDQEKQQSKSQFKDVTEQQVAHYIADNIYQPSVFAVNESVLLLNESIIELCHPQTKESLMDSLLQAQIYWKESIALWRESRAYQISPIKSLYVYQQVDQLPVNTIIIDAVLKDASVHPGEKERSIYGYASLEYLLFADNDAKAALTQLKDKQTCQFLKNTAVDLAKNIKKIKKYWLTEPDGAKQQFKEAKGKFYLDQKEVTTNIVAQMLNSIEVVVWHKMGLPSNFFRGNPELTKLDAWRSQSSLSNIKAVISGVDKIYGDIETMGIYHLIDAKDKKLANSIRSHFDHINLLLDKLTLPIEEGFNDPPDEFEEIFHELQELQNELTEMAKELELKLVFEEDGD